MSVLGQPCSNLQRAVIHDMQQQGSQRQHRQFSKEQLVAFGSLKEGQIPEPLNYVKPFEVTTLPNGIRVCTEPWESLVTAIGVFIGTGSRNEPRSDSGAAHFLEHLSFKGTRKRSRIQLEKEVENLGSQLNAYTSREHTLYHMLSFRENAAHSIEVLADMLCNSLYDNYHLEMEKETIWQELLATNQDFMETLMEQVYSNIYKHHQMGMPILGDIDNIYQINRDMVTDFHETNYFGDNIVVAGTGAINHQQLVELTANHFSKMPKQNPKELKNMETPEFHSETLFIRDDEMMNSNVGIFYPAPSWKDKDFYAFLLLQRVFSSYSAERHQEHLADVSYQYNTMHSILGGLPEVQRHECIFSPYSDCGIFGHYMFGNDNFGRQMNYCGEVLSELYSREISEVELQRAKQKLFIELLGIESATDALQQIGPQFLYLDRRVTKTEIAHRIASITTKDLATACNKWFLSKEKPSMTNWGPIKGIEQEGTYKYFKVNQIHAQTDLNRLLSSK